MVTTVASAPRRRCGLASPVAVQRLNPIFSGRGGVVLCTTH